MTRQLIALVGPTAVGKTSVGVELAQTLESIVVSADSRQFYKEMSIGTAKPTLEEQSGIPHFFIDSHSIHEPLSAGDYERQALSLLEKQFEHYPTLCLVGGSGLFVDALCRGLDDLPQPVPGVRERLNQQFELNGIRFLQQQLQNVDPDYFSAVDQSNPQRLIRALEVFESTGIPFSKYRTNQMAKRPFQTIKIGLDLPREELYARINRRVEQMMQKGLLHEVQGLWDMRQLPACQTVGYTELFAYLEGQCSLDEAIAKIQQNSRRYAKRQLTWFKKDTQTRWFHPSDLAGILSYLEQVGVRPN
jgi:tRNA dimethylallyltransferase